MILQFANTPRDNRSRQGGQQNGSLGETYTTIIMFEANVWSGCFRFLQTRASQTIHFLKRTFPPYPLRSTCRVQTWYGTHKHKTKIEGYGSKCPVSRRQSLRSFLYYYIHFIQQIDVSPLRISSLNRTRMYRCTVELGMSSPSNYETVIWPGTVTPIQLSLKYLSTIKVMVWANRGIH